MQPKMFSIKKKFPSGLLMFIIEMKKQWVSFLVFFILDTILLGQLMKVNPFDQPSVELIKKETFKILR